MKKDNRRRLLTKEQDEYLRKNVKFISNKKLAELINKKFNLNLKPRQVSNYKKNHKIFSGLTGHFEKGRVPINKGTKGMFNVGGNSTSFRAGRVPFNYRPVGFERVCNKEGYIFIKVSDYGSYYDRWKHKQTVVWEKHHGKVPHNHVVAFLDTNKQNVDINNLILISRSELAAMNRYYYFSSDPEITRAAISFVRLSQKIRHTKFGVKDGTELKELMCKAKENGVSEIAFIGRLERGWSMDEAINRPLHSRR